MTVMDTLKARIREKVTTEQIVNALGVYDQTSEATLDQDARMVRAALSDVLCERLPEVDALMEKWFADESPEGLEFTMNTSYTTMILKALDETGGIR